jgi:predicted permease
MRQLLLRLGHLLRRRQFDNDLAEELEFHRLLKQREFEDRGQAPADAAFAARRALGSQALALDESRDAWIWPWLADGVRDIRYGARMLSRSPGFTLVAILTLALGIGANTAIFGLINALMLRPLPVRDARHLLFFGDVLATGSTGFTPTGSTQLFSYAFFRDFRRSNQVFEEVAAIGSILYPTNGRVAGGGLEKIKIELVSGSYFNTLGVRAIAGRVLSDRDDQIPGGHPLAVASHAWWQQRFGGGPVVGTTISIGSRSYDVIGVAQAQFSGVTVGQSPDIWIPLAMQREIWPGWSLFDDRMFQTLHLVGRLKTGVAPAAAQTATNLLFRQLLTDYIGPRASPQTTRNIQRSYIDLTPARVGRSELRTEFSSALAVLMALVALVLLIACANVANLLLARASARQREVAVRMSLGAGRLRIVRQLLAESLLLGVAGASLGLAFAAGASRLLVAIVSAGTEPLSLQLTPDLPVLAFTLMATLATVLAFGAVPALYATRLNLVPALKDGGAVTSSSGRSRLSRWLVVGQVALSVALIAGAALFIHRLSNVMSIDTGFDKRDVLVAGFDPGGAGYQVDARYNAMMERVEDRVAHLPGVRAAGFALSVFNGGGWSTNNISIPGRIRSPNDRGVVLNIVGAQYLDAVRMPILAGRGLSERDTASTPKVAVIDETMARTYFGDPLPLGRTFSVADDEKADAEQWKDVEVVGVVRSAKYFTLLERQRPAVFFPHAQHLRYFLFSFVVRHDRAVAATLMPAIRKAVAEVDPNLPIRNATTLSRLVDDSVVNRRAVAELSAFFGVLAIVLASIGIYGVTSYGITRRTTEFGVRLALGAQRRDVLWLVLRETARLSATGVVFGLALALAAGRFVTSLLFNLAPYDPSALVAAVSAMIAVALCAGYLPARRATRIDPLLALRSEESTLPSPVVASRPP